MNIEELYGILIDFQFEYCFMRKIKTKNIIVKEIYPKNNDMYLVIENKITQTLETYSINHIRRCIKNAKTFKPL